jgi:two-component system response regulator RstA
MSGLDLLKQLRPLLYGWIILLSDQDNDLEQIFGFELGADDFVVKPVEALVLMARIRALMRRRSAEQNKEGPRIIMIGDLKVDTARREAYRNGKLLDLTTTQFDLLAYLISNAGVVVTRNEMSRILHNMDYDGMNRSVDIYICRLRQKLGDHPSNPHYVKTVRGTGYLFAAEKSS